MHISIFPPTLHNALSILLFPVLFTLYTVDCTGTDTTPIIINKNSDDSAIEDFSNPDSVYFAEVERFSNWCGHNSLDLNVKKNKGNVD